jgi:hypothetical protein
VGRLEGEVVDVDVLLDVDGVVAAPEVLVVAVPPPGPPHDRSRGVASAISPAALALAMRWRPTRRCPVGTGNLGDSSSRARYPAFLLTTCVA